MPSPTTKNGQQFTVPRATYRFQFHEGFPLSQALALVPYLHGLGISHLYASPLFKARPHSRHGYDTCDFNQLNPELGTEAELAQLVGALRARGMGLVLDIVPNHMGIGGPENHWWWDVLARGPESPYAKYFDIDWNSSDPRLRGKVLVPVLGDRYHRVLARHELQLETTPAGCLLHYGENPFPINAPSLQAVTSNPEELNANPEALDALLEKQFYRLTWYGRGDSELNYRRFFNITTLPGLCMEDEQVFTQSFSLARQWLERGWLDGLRVDHPDGLRDPEQFLNRLKNIAPKAWIVVEKILEPGEVLPSSWPVAGTTGYDFLNCADGLFIDPNGEKPLTDLYLACGGNPKGYSALAREKKVLVLQTLLGAEVGHLTELLVHIAAAHWRYRDFTRKELSAALIELIASFSVYRTYVHPEKKSVGDSDRFYLLKAAGQARQARPDLPSDLFDLLTDLMLLRQQGETESDFVARFQQLSAATMAKGVEDTAFYCYNRFAALNEVGGDPGRFGTSVEEFHQFCLRQQTDWPNTMLASSTHDTKRSEDARARLWLLSEIPGIWREAVGRWSALNKRHCRHQWPDSNAEYLYYQTLVGAWPLSAERALEYMKKATHEAKEHTNWTEKNEEYDSAVHDFVTATLADREFLADMEKFVAPLVKPGCVNSLAQLLLKLTAPGAPDIYQGTELWDFSLVDPDNRRPVDFLLRQKLLANTADLSAEKAWQEWNSGLPKLWLIRRVLALRSRHPDWFGRDAQYQPLAAQGPACAHAVIFKRGENLIALVPRLIIGLHYDWRDTVLEMPPGNWRNELTGDIVPQKKALLSDLLAKFPVALLIQGEHS
jgi:(1->4)-alpha-D-glucan 1-alpha-D-glucosylmutase